MGFRFDNGWKLISKFSHFTFLSFWFGPGYFGVDVFNFGFEWEW